MRINGTAGSPFQVITGFTPQKREETCLQPRIPKKRGGLGDKRDHVADLAPLNLKSACWDGLLDALLTAMKSPSVNVTHVASLPPALLH